MGHGGVAEGWRGTQRPTLTTVVVVAALVFLSTSAGLASASHHHICQAGSSVKLMPYETAYFTSRAPSVRFRVEAVGCVNDTHELRLAGLEVSNETSTHKKIQWYEFSYINCEKYVVNIGSKIVKLKSSSHKCIDKLITLSVASPALLGKKCLSPVRDKAVEKGKAACKALAGVADTGHSLVTEPVTGNLDKLLELLKHKSYGGAPDSIFDPSSFGDVKNDGKSLFDTPGLFFGGQQELKGPKVDDGYISDMFKTSSFKYEDFLPVARPTVPTNNLDDDSFFDNETFSKRRNYKENAIPIFIGIVAFTVSMCLRFCLCRGKSVVRRVTTVTVIRSRPSNSSDAAQDQQDPPPAYVDVVNENMPHDSPADDPCAEPPPPAYADIAHEVLPPSYSEVEAQSMSPSEAASLADQETVTQTSSPPPDPGSGPDDKGSGSPRGVLSKYRSQQKQFAFKVLEEDE